MINSELSVTVVVLTYNAGDSFYDFCRALKNQNVAIEKVLVIDSSSEDNTVKIAKEFGFEVVVIAQNEFGHGKTRQMALEMISTENVVFMTQDALLFNNNAIGILVEYLNSVQELGAVYGRQLPYPQTKLVGAFARIYNYPEKSFINTLSEKKTKGIKVVFFSDTFAAYKRSILLEMGGFPVHANFGEDSYISGKILLAGYKTGYCADAMVFHAHDYGLMQEFRRGQAIKHFHKQEPWLLKEFGKAEGEGLKFVLTEAKWLISRGYWYMLPLAFIHNFVKFLGYKIG